MSASLRRRSCTLLAQLDRSLKCDCRLGHRYKWDLDHPSILDFQSFGKAQDRFWILDCESRKFHESKKRRARRGRDSLGFLLSRSGLLRMPNETDRCRLNFEPPLSAQEHPQVSA